MRYEVVFQTPEIALVKIDDQPSKKSQDDPQGIPYALEEKDNPAGHKKYDAFPEPFPPDLVKTLKQNRTYDPQTETLVSWIALLRLASAQENRIKSEGFTPRQQSEVSVGVRTAVAVYLRERTWDFMPPDMV